MSATTKKWLNRGGLIAVIAGFALILIGSGDRSAAITTAGLIVDAAGGLVILIRELFN